MPGNKYKIVVIGPAKSGKTAFITRAGGDNFSASYNATVGLDFYSLNSSGAGYCEDQDADRLQVWDLAGQEKFRNLDRIYYREASAVVLVTDLSLWADNNPAVVKKAQDDLTFFIDKLKECFGESLPPLYLVGTKQDLIASKDIEKTAVNNLNAYAKANNINNDHVFITTSKEKYATSAEAQIRYPSQIFNTIYSDLNAVKCNQEIVVDSSVPAANNATGNNAKTGVSWGGQVAAMFIGAFVGAVTGIIIHNPVTCFLAAWRTTDWAEWNIPNIFRIFIFAPIINPLVAMSYGAIRGGAVGIEHGVSKKLGDIPRDMSEPFKLRTIITGSVLSVFIGAAVAIAVIHLLPVALPILLGLAGATALVAGIGYEGIDSVLTDNELQKTLKNKSASKPLLEVDDEPSLELRSSSRSSPHVTSSTQQNSVMAVNVYEKAHNTGSWRSWFQVPPAAPEPPIDSQRWDSNHQIALDR